MSKKIENKEEIIKKEVTTDFNEIENVNSEIKSIIEEKIISTDDITKDKTLNAISNEDLKEKVSDVEIFGEDIWNLLCKASSKNQGWMKSTKVMNVFGGCIVQVTTQNKDSIAESLVFVPHNTFKNGKIIGC